MHTTQRRTLAVVLSAAFLFAGAFAQPARADYPQVGGLIAFTKETNFMSLPGYLRYLNFQQVNSWMSHAEALRIVKQQSGTA